MAVRVNEHYLTLRGGSLFPEIARRVRAFSEANPAASERLIHCGIGDVTEPLPEACRAAMHEAVDELGDRATFRGYGDPTGYAFLREAIAEGDFASRGVRMTADEIFISDGSKVDCGAVLDILGDDNRIGVPDPVYPVYVDTNVMAGHTGPGREDGSYEGLVYLPCTADNGFVCDVPDERLDLIYLCYPNNPTGGMINRERLAAWVEYALKHQSLILYDVAYDAFISDPDLPKTIYEIDGADQCAIEFHSFSKNAGFTGVRCGYTVCPRTLKGLTTGERSISMHDLWTRRWSTKSNSVSYPVQRGAAAVYTEAGRQQVAALVEHYMGNARILAEGCTALGLTTYGGVSSPYVWVACPDGVDSWRMFDRMLQDANIVITPGAGFGKCGEGYIRISAFNSRDNVETAVERLQQLCITA